MLREGLAHLLGTQSSLEVVAEAGTASEALDLAVTAAPDLAIVDLSLPDASGVEIVRRLKQVRPDLPILVFSLHEEPAIAAAVLRAGANGYVAKCEGAGELLDGVGHVIRGATFISRLVTDALLDKALQRGSRSPSWPLDDLTPRERQIFVLIGQGRSSGAIAEKFGISPKTVASHRQNIRHKLAFGDSSELVHRAIRWVESGGLLSTLELLDGERTKG